MPGTCNMREGLQTLTASAELNRMQDAQSVVVCGRRDLSMPKFQWDVPMLSNGAQVPFSSREIDRTVSVSSDPYKARTGILDSQIMLDRPHCDENRGRA